MRKDLLVTALATSVLTLAPAGAAFAHVHAVTPLGTLAHKCGVTSFDNTGANRAQGEPLLTTHGPVPIRVGSAPGLPGSGAEAPVGCAR
jgi:hypothetical protein